MTDSGSTFTRLERAVGALPRRYAGPGGAVAVLRDGEVLVRHAWGWADTEQRLPFTPQTMSLICSITKQFTCGLLLDLFPEPTTLNDEVRRLMPDLQQEAPGILDLCHNQSGLRDYWALAMLCGAPVEGVFGPQDAHRLIGRTRTLHFQPGTAYSYVNQNFRILSEIIERQTSQSFADLLRYRIFDRAAMPHAALNAVTTTVPGGTLGYEGSAEFGFRPAVNRIHWTGDAGLTASLDDMIAWESFIDAARDDPQGLYNRLSAPQVFRNGAPAFYGFGLSHATLFGRRATCHAGGLRGFRSFRLYVPAERVSVVVLFNHMADPQAAALDLLGAALGEVEPKTPAISLGSGWAGRYIESASGLSVRVEPVHDGSLQFHYGPLPDILRPTAQRDYRGGGNRLYRRGDTLWLNRPSDNLDAPLIPCTGDASPDIEGLFHSDELDATLTCTSSGGALYGAFSGALGEGEMLQLTPFGPDRWLLPCPRALDFHPPGDWTLKFRRDERGEVAGLEAGCWLARGVSYERRH
jgi:D-aminopeptidase